MRKAARKNTKKSLPPVTRPGARQNKATSRVPSDSKSVDVTLPTKKTGVPLYVQVASTLRIAIVRGIYPVGSRIPTEDELCARFVVSRHTIREALRRLRAEGLITSRQGGRPIVIPPSAQKTVRRWSAEVSKDFFDNTMGARLVIESMELAHISKATAARFEIDHGDEWLRVSGYRQVGEAGAKVCWHEYLIKAEFAAVGRLLPRHVGPIIPLLEDLFGERFIKISYWMSAIGMPAEQATVFHVAAGSPAMKVLTRCETIDDKLAIISLLVHPGGENAFSVNLHDEQLVDS